MESSTSSNAISRGQSQSLASTGELAIFTCGERLDLDLCFVVEFLLVPFVRGFAMTRFLLFVVMSVALLGCGSVTPSKPAVVGIDPALLRRGNPPDTVNWRTMVQDRQTLTSYSGRVVRFRVEASDCYIDKEVMKVWYAGNRDEVPPVLIVVAVTPIEGFGAWTVTGVCGEPVYDDIKRGRWVNYYVYVTAATTVAAR